MKPQKVIWNPCDVHHKVIIKAAIGAKQCGGSLRDFPLVINDVK